MSDIYDLTTLTRCNWHIHTNLSSCASSEMTVSNIFASAEVSGIETIAFVDHHHRREHNVLTDIASLRNEIDRCQTKLKVFVGAELSAFGIGKYSDSLETNRRIEYRLYACNHYHLNYWEHPTTKTPRAYAEHSLAILTGLLPTRRADCIAHPFLGTYTGIEPTSVTRSMSDKELGDILKLGKDNNVAWEFNAPGLLSDRKFARRYWNIGQEIGVGFRFGTDAHHLSEIDARQFLAKFRSILGKY